MMHEMRPDIEFTRFVYDGFRVFIMRSPSFCAHTVVYEHVRYPLAYMRIVEQLGEPTDVLGIDEIKRVAMEFIDRTKSQLIEDLKVIFESGDDSCTM